MYHGITSQGYVVRVARLWRCLLLLDDRALLANLLRVRLPALRPQRECLARRAAGMMPSGVSSSSSLNAGAVAAGAGCGGAKPSMGKMFLLKKFPPSSGAGRGR